MLILGLTLFFFLLIVLQRLIYSHFWCRNLSVDLSFSAATGLEGNTVRLTEQITSRKWLPLPWLTVKFQVSRDLIFPDRIHAAITDDYYREDLFSLGMYQRISRILLVVMRKRGFYCIKGIDLLSSDLLLTRKLLSHETSLSSLTVCPRILDRDELSVPYRHLIGQVLAKPALQFDPFEFRTIREYQEFDDMRSINWLATARTGQLKVNVHENTASREVRILLNVEPDAVLCDASLIEAAIRVAASIGTYLNEDGISCSFTTNGRDAVSLTSFELEAGQSARHNQQIQEGLGRLDLDLVPERFAEVLERLPIPGTNEPILLLVSVDSNAALCRAWMESLERGYAGLWIVPRPAGTAGRLPEINSPYFVWEVRDHAA